MKNSKRLKILRYFIMELLALFMLLLTTYEFKQIAEPMFKEEETTNVTKSIPESEEQTTDNPSNLFENAELVQSGWFYQRSETQFDDVIYYEITKKDAKMISQALKKASTTEEVILFDKNTYQYQMYLYDETGKQVYWLFVDADGKIGYDGKRLVGKALQEWIDNIVDASKWVPYH